MKTRMVLSLGLSALVLGGTMVGCTGQTGGIASASDRSDALAAKGAAQNAGRAQAALAHRNGAVAVRYAEGAVGLVPQSAEYRMLLAQSYMQAGRFGSARQSFADVLTLTPDNGKAALNKALAEVATGDWQAARATLNANATIIPASDRGLALALAGDTGGAIALLTEVARSPEASAKVRQNLALSLALSGQWQAARVVAAADMAPADVDARLEQWAQFAQPAAASDQVASMLGVHAVVDAGQPTALALNRTPSAPAQGLAAVEPVAPAPAVEAPVAVAATGVVQAVPAATPAAVAGFSRVSFAPHMEVVQALPTVLLRPADGPTKVALGSRAAFAVKAVASAPASGTWYVQLGAFENAGVAKDAWGHATRRFAAFSGRQPTGMNFTNKGNDYYRLSVGGYARAEADTVCRQYRAKGGACFVRAGAGDQMAQWLRKGAVQVASR